MRKKFFKPLNESFPYFAGDSIVEWRWEDGVSSNIDTTYQPSGAVYPYAGNYVIRLYAEDNRGCIDSLFKPLSIAPAPFVEIVAQKDKLCQGQADTLVAYHSDTLTWYPAAAVPCTTCDTIIVSPGATTSFIAEARNSYSCVVRDTFDVVVYAPFTASAPATTKYICQNDTVTISVSPPGKVVAWDPPTGLSDPSSYSPVAAPAVSTNYVATLTDSAGCFSSSVAVNILVNSLPTVDAGPDLVLPYNSGFTFSPVYSANSRMYDWSPGVNLTCTTCPQPSGTALQEQLYVIKVESDSGCIAKDSVRIMIECAYANLLVPGAFTPNNDGRNDVFYPITRGIKTVKRFVIFNRLGQKIFEIRDFDPNDRSRGWNGKFNGQDAEPGAYVYMMEAVCETGNLIQKKDSFILLR